MAGRDMTMRDWHKSTASAAANCVEGRFVSDHVQVRDTKNKNGAVLRFTHDEWRAFVAGLRVGEFDIPSTTAVPS